MLCFRPAPKLISLSSPFRVHFITSSSINMQGFSESSSSAHIALPNPNPKLSLGALAKSIWTCPSMCTEQASHALIPSDALGGDPREAFRKKTLADILDLKERMMGNKKRLRPEIVIEPFNVKVIAPCEDCQFIGYDKLNDLIADHVAAFPNPGLNVDQSENLAGNYDEVVMMDCCKGCLCDSVAIPFEPVACASKGEENNNKTEAGADDHAGKIDSTSKL